MTSCKFYRCVMLRLFLACHDLEVDRWYEEGTSWSGDSDPCVHCECQVGQGQGRWADSNPCAQIATRSKKGDGRDHCVYCYLIGHPNTNNVVEGVLGGPVVNVLNDIVW